MKKTLHSESLFDSRPYGFSQITISSPGKMVFISGQVAWDENLTIIGKGDLNKQTQKSLGNLKLVVYEVCITS